MISINKNIQSFEEGDFIKIDASVQTFNNDLQLNIKKIRRAREGEYFEEDYVPSTKKDVNEMFNRVTDYIKSVNDKYIKELLTNIFVKNHFTRRFIN